MHQQYNGGWTTHSNDVITRVAEKLIMGPHEVMIMEQNAFSPRRWYEDDELSLWMPHDDVPSNLDNRTQGDELPSFDIETSTEWRTREKEIRQTSRNGPGIGLLPICFTRSALDSCPIGKATHALRLAMPWRDAATLRGRYTQWLRRCMMGVCSGLMTPNRIRASDELALLGNKGQQGILVVELTENGRLLCGLT